VAERPEARALYERLLQRGVIVRPLGPYGLAEHLRITVGTEAENARLLHALGELA
jgi:histidinol-phosphate aminotransferase